MERESTKHGPRLDEELERETESLVRGAPIESRVEEEREKEGPGEEDHDVDVRTGPAGAFADDVEARRELSRHLRPRAFPADRDSLVAEARENNAPEPVVELLAGLPGRVRFKTAHEVYAVLEDPALSTDRGRLRERTATDPLHEADR